MSIKSTHPLYDEMQDVWSISNDSYVGEKAIKAKAFTYLPATIGMLEDGAGTGDKNSLGNRAYDGLLIRAVYPDDYKEAVKVNVGSMHRKEASIELPEALEPLRENATALGESLQQVLMRINLTQCKSGRLGLLGDITSGTDSKPYLSLYTDLAIRNWDSVAKPLNDETDNNASLVVLDETGYKLNENLKWERKESFRVLSLVEPDGKNYIRNPDSGKYGVAVSDNTSDDINGLKFEVPSYRGNELTSIPFAFINASNNAPEPENPPLLGLAQLCRAIDGGEGDYRQNLSMQGQDTLVTIGEGQGGNNLQDKDSLRTGAGARIKVPMGGDAKYIGVSADGLSEQRTCLENDKAKASRRSGLLVESGAGVESGDALKIKTSAQTATLPQIAMAGAEALEKVLKQLAIWIGADPKKVKVTPNLEFSDEILDGKTLVDIVDAKLNGAPISWESIHCLMAERGLTKLTFTDEITLIKAEVPIGVSDIPPPNFTG